MDTHFQGFLKNRNSYPVARVFPYGGWKIKTAVMMDAKSMKDAKKMALQSLPDETTKINKMNELEHFVHSSYDTAPPRFPVLLFTGKKNLFFTNNNTAVTASSIHTLN
jgi:predicted HTH transcriptional regulator